MTTETNQAPPADTSNSSALSRHGTGATSSEMVHHAQLTPSNTRDGSVPRLALEDTLERDFGLASHEKDSTDGSIEAVSKAAAPHIKPDLHLNDNTADAVVLQSSPLLKLPGEVRNVIYRFAVVMTNTEHGTLLSHKSAHHHEIPWHVRNKCRSFIGLSKVSKQLQTEFGPYASMFTIWIRFSEIVEYLTTFPLADEALNEEIVTACKALNDKKVVMEKLGVDILPLIKADWEHMPFCLYPDYSDGDRNPLDTTHWIMARVHKGTFAVHGDVYGRSIFTDGTIQSLRIIRMNPWKSKYGTDEGNVKIITFTFGKTTYGEPSREDEFKTAVLAYLADMVGYAYPSTQFRCEISGVQFAASGGNEYARRVIKLE